MGRLEGGGLCLVVMGCGGLIYAGVGRRYSHSVDNLAGFSWFLYHDLYGGLEEQL